MLTREQAEEILRTLASLPPEKVAEVHDFALFLKRRCESEATLDDSDEWSDEDLRDLAAAALRHAAQLDDEKPA